MRLEQTKHQDGDLQKLQINMYIYISHAFPFLDLLPLDKAIAFSQNVRRPETFLVLRRSSGYHNVVWHVVPMAAPSLLTPPRNSKPIILLGPGVGPRPHLFEV